MAEADLDGVIRSVAKKQIKDAGRCRQEAAWPADGAGGKAKDKDAKARFKDLAKNTLELAAAAARRLEITADNAANSYMRSMKRVIEEQAAAKAANKAAGDRRQGQGGEGEGRPRQDQGQARQEGRQEKGLILAQRRPFMIRYR